MSDPSGGGQEPAPEATEQERLAKPLNKEIVKVKADKEFVKESFKEKHEKDKPEKEKPEKEKHDKEKQEKEKPEKEKHDKEKHEQEGKAKHDKETHKEKHDKDFAKEKESKIEVIEKKPEIFKDPGEFGPPGNPLIDPAVQLDPNALLAHAEVLQESLRHFIEQSQRPDLSEGALKDEPDQQGEG